MNKQVQLGLKRSLDLVISFIGLTLLIVPFAIIALAIKLDSKGPVFFRQERVGLNGRIFKTGKFRTMVEGSVNKGLGYNVARDDPRITRVGAVLRDWGLDELPQLITGIAGWFVVVYSF